MRFFTRVRGGVVRVLEWMLERKEEERWPEWRPEERTSERGRREAGGRSRLQPKRIGARGLNDPSHLGRHPEWPPPVSRFTAIRFLPPF